MSGHTGTDLRRLIDAGYSATFSSLDGEYLAEITSEMGSRWKGLGATPGEALRFAWPLGDGPGQGGCGHCGTLGCDIGSCPVCAAYTENPGNGVCGVCGAGYPIADEDELPGRDEDEPGEDENMAGPETPCRASSQLGTKCAELGLHSEHDDHKGTTWAAM